MNFTLLVAVFLFAVGLLIIITRKNSLIVLMGLELTLTATMINFIAFSEGYDAHLLVLLIIVITVAEVTIALALIYKIYKQFGHIDLGKTVEEEK